jgi:hypothetical protein
MNTTEKAREREEIETLLPWHAAGTLSRRDAARVEAALQADAELARSYSLVREEFGETIHLNETLGAPSSRAFEKLMAGIEAEAGPVRQSTRSLAFSEWLSEKLALLSPRTLTLASAAAAIAILLQAGIIAKLYTGANGTPGAYETASKHPTTDLGAGSFALVGFKPEATSGDITDFLQANKLAIVDGPRAGGLYRVRLAPEALSKEAATAAVGKLREGGIVRFVAPTE